MSVCMDLPLPLPQAVIRLRGVLQSLEERERAQGPSLTEINHTSELRKRLFFFLVRQGLDCQMEFEESERFFMIFS